MELRKQIKKFLGFLLAVILSKAVSHLIAGWDNPDLCMSGRAQVHNVILRVVWKDKEEIS